LYYYYNEQTKTYEVYENKDENKWTKKKYKKRATNLFGENFVLVVFVFKLFLKNFSF